MPIYILVNSAFSGFASLKPHLFIKTLLFIYGTQPTTS